MAFSIGLFVALFTALPQDDLIIQENTLGVCTMDGVIESSADGYTGEGYANIDGGLNIGMSWSFNLESAGEYKIYIRYALGGSDVTSRDAIVLVNNAITSDTLLFPHSGSSSWAEWIITDTLRLTLQEGYNKINLLSITEKGLPNIDYFHVIGGICSPVACIPSFTLSVNSNDTLKGSVDYFPQQELYDIGTEISISAEASTGYFFHSWSGEEASSIANDTFEIRKNTQMTALFYPEGVVSAENAIGYATVQHDNGTPYLLNGGSLGETVQAGTLQELKNYLEASEPFVVLLNAHIQGDNSDEININSNKTLIGTNENSHIEGIPVNINGSRNIIIQHVTFSKVIQVDELEINGGAMNIWIDHCNFFTDREHEVDYYDGLIDIKNQSRFITISWTKFHDHQKSILISSGDQEVSDSLIRVTFHHNYFYDCDSRLPSIRFGKAHIFNNYYRNVGSGINTRMEACVRVEHNYFENAGTAVGMLYSPIPGSVELIDNIFDNSGYSDEPVCILDVPYEYLEYLHTAEQVPDSVLAGTGGSINSLFEEQQPRFDFRIYPNPSRGIIYLTLYTTEFSIDDFILYDIMGRQLPLNKLNIRKLNSGEFEMDLSHLAEGLYFVILKSQSKILSKAFHLQH